MEQRHIELRIVNRQIYLNRNDLRCFGKARDLRLSLNSFELD